jgi:hypothetical protein
MDDATSPIPQSDTRLAVWQERGEIQITLHDDRPGADDAEIVSWDTEEATQAIEDGFLTLGTRSRLGKISEQDYTLHASAYAYAEEHGLLPDSSDYTEEQIEQALRQALEEPEEYAEEPLTLATISTYDDAGILTRDRGLVLRTPSGSEYQITIKYAGKSRY